MPTNHLAHMPIMRLSVLSHQGGAAQAAAADTGGESEDDSPFVQRRQSHTMQQRSSTYSAFCAATTTSSGPSTPLGGSPPPSVPLPQPLAVVGLPSRELSGRCTRMWYDQLPGDLGMSMRERDSVSSFVMAPGAGQPAHGSTDSFMDKPTNGNAAKEPASLFITAPSRTSDAGSRLSRSSTSKGTGRHSQAHDDIVRNAMLEARVTIEGQRQMSRSLSKRMSKVSSGRRRSGRMTGVSSTKEAAAAPGAVSGAQQQRRVPVHVGLGPECSSQLTAREDN